MTTLAPPPPAAGGRSDHVPTRTGVRMTAEEFLALADDPTLDRWLIDGEVWEQPGVPGEAAVHSRPHSACVSRISYTLSVWLRGPDAPGGEVASGGAGVRLPERETVVGLDVVYFDADAVDRQPPPRRFVLNERLPLQVWVGVPRLAVEVVEATDREGDITAKLHEYLAAGVPQVWIARPGFRTVTVHRSDAPAAVFQGDAVLTGGPELPGFEARAADLFGG